jgi:hypothetical protein
LMIDINRFPHWRTSTTNITITIITLFFPAHRLVFSYCVMYFWVLVGALGHVSWNLWLGICGVAAWPG